MICASQATIAVGPEIWTPGSSRTAAQKSSEPATAIPSAVSPTAISAVTAGPAAATLNSAPGDSVSLLILATPPNSHRVISVIGTPSRFASTAWPSSWSRIEAKKANAEATASRYGSLSDWPTSSTSR